MGLAVPAIQGQEAPHTTVRAVLLMTAPEEPVIQGPVDQCTMVLGVPSMMVREGQRMMVRVVRPMMVRADRATQVQVARPMTV